MITHDILISGDVNLFEELFPLHALKKSFELHSYMHNVNNEDNHLHFNNVDIPSSHNNHASSLAIPLQCTTRVCAPPSYSQEYVCK